MGLLMRMDAVGVDGIARRGGLNAVKLAGVPRVMLLSQFDRDRCGGVVVHWRQPSRIGESAPTTMAMVRVVVYDARLGWPLEGDDSGWMINTHKHTSPTLLYSILCFTCLASLFTFCAFCLIQYLKQFGVILSPDSYYAEARVSLLARIFWSLSSPLQFPSSESIIHWSNYRTGR